ncbi:MAG: IS701 family transposase [Chloroflexi bacterium]|nr:IS701 family transposase [Chloroflexota bacterium]
MAQHAAALVDQTATVLRPHFRRPEAHRHAADSLRGLIAEVERKNGWQLAEQVGYSHPRGMQCVLDRYGWDPDAVRDDLRRYAVAPFGDPQGVLVVAATGFPPQGKHSVGVAGRYCGTLGKIANCQVGVFLGYASPRGQVALDRALFLPKEWCADRERCGKAGILAAVAYRTKPALALTLRERALGAGVPAAWVTGDAVYGSDGNWSGSSGRASAPRTTLRCGPAGGDAISRSPKPAINVAA